MLDRGNLKDGSCLNHSFFCFFLFQEWRSEPRYLLSVTMSAAQYYDKPTQPQGGYVPPTYPVPPSGGQQYAPQQQYAPPSMPPTAPYAEPSYANPSSYTNNNPADMTTNPQFAVSDGNEKTGQRFKPKKRFNDPIFAILFVACFIGFVVLSAITIRQFVKYNGGGGGFGDIGGTSATLD